ncbi:MAG: hypothetical protein HY208_05375 [Nitrospirae bacterium]|nr:hypothetical protein [Nitrospirota bacterium]
MQPPKDQGLFLTVFITVCVVVILGGWLALPVHKKVVIEGVEESEAEQGPEPVILGPAVTPEERIRQMERIIGLAEAAVADLEKTGSKETGSKKKGSTP